MSISGRLQLPRISASGNLSELISQYLGGSNSYAGTQVSADTAMRQATVYSCVNILSRVMGMIPCHLMRRVGKNREKAETHRLYSLLHDMPNEWMTSSDHWKMVMNHLLLRGNYFAIKNRGLSLTNPVRELIPLAPGIVTSVEQLPNYKLIYHCQFPDGEQKNIPGSEIFHLKGMTSNGYMGITPMQYMREPIGFALAAEKFGEQLFGNGMNPGAIIEIPTNLRDNKAYRAALAEEYQGLDNSHRLLLMAEGSKFTKLSISPEDSQFLELRKFQKNEIVDMMLGHPLTVMNSGDNNPTFASAEQFAIGLVVYSLMPTMVDIEKTVYKDLLTIEERKTYYAKFQAAQLLRGSFKDQTEGFATLIDKEVLNPNEVRDILDMNGYGPQGDVYKTRTSTVKEETKPATKGDQK